MQFDWGGILFIFLAIVVIIGIVMFSRWRHGKGFNLRFEWAGFKSDKTQHNCFNIYPDRVCFETKDEKELTGIPWKFLNDGKYYYINEKIGDKLVKFTLPDVDSNTIHYDPIEVKNVITMPRNKEYLNWSSSMFQKIALGVMCFIVIGEFVMLVILSGGGTPSG